MAYLYKAGPPMCAVNGCTFQGRYIVRGRVPLRRQFPRCRRHAEELYALLETEERSAQPPDSAASVDAGEGLC